MRVGDSGTSARLPLNVDDAASRPPQPDKDMTTGEHKPRTLEERDMKERIRNPPLEDCARYLELRGREWAEKGSTNDAVVLRNMAASVRRAEAALAALPSGEGEPLRAALERVSDLAALHFPPEEARWSLEALDAAHAALARPPAGEGALRDLLRRARRNVEHSASHPQGAKSRELLAEIDAALATPPAAEPARCDCGSPAATACPDCIIAEYQAAHPDCPECCVPLDAAEPAPREAHSKSEYRRLTAQGVSVLPPAAAEVVPICPICKEPLPHHAPRCTAVQP